MAAIPARQASVTYVVGDTALTVAAVRSIIRKRALAAADMGLVDLMGEDLEIALGGLSTHSLRVGLTQDLFASGEDAHHNIFHPARGRNGCHAQLDIERTEFLEFDFAILRAALLRNIEIAHDLDPRNQGIAI